MDVVECGLFLVDQSVAATVDSDLGSKRPETNVEMEKYGQFHVSLNAHWHLVFTMVRYAFPDFASF